MHYFDSDMLVASSQIQNVYVPYKYQGNGVKVTLEVKKLFLRELVNSIGAVIGLRGNRFSKHGWLCNVTTKGDYRYR